MTANQLIVKMCLDRWNALIKNGDNLLQSITDEQLNKEIAVGKNRGIYVLGHLIAVHDAMLPLMNMGDKEYENLNEIFLKSPDKTFEKIPSAQELRVIWKNQSEYLVQKFNNLPKDEWFEKHTAVSSEDFINEPHRNKLNILITRTSHLSYHLGQLVLLK